MKNVTVAAFILIVSAALTACSVHPAVRAVELLTEANAWTSGPPPYDCTSEMPGDLKAVLTHKYPAKRLPIAADDTVGDIASVDVFVGIKGCYQRSAAVLQP